MGYSSKYPMITVIIFLVDTKITRFFPEKWCTYGTMGPRLVLTALLDCLCRACEHTLKASYQREGSLFAA